MHYYLARGDENNIRNSILTPINKYIGLENLEENVHGWAISRGVSKNRSKSAKYSKDMDYGDKIIIWPNGESKNIYLGTIIKTEIGRDIPKKIWGKGTDSKYDCTIFIREVKKINIEKKELIKKLGYKGAPQGIGELKGKKIDAINNIINNKNTVSKEKYTEEDKDKLLELVLFDKYWHKESNEVKCTWDLNLNNISTKSKRKIKKSKKVGRIKKLSYRIKKLIGLTGEKKAHQFICENKEQILKRLGIKYKDVNSGEIRWFNADIKIENLEKEKDKSVGKGYDIEILIGSNIIKFEVKSSYEGNVNEIVLTRNELIEMKHSNVNNNEFYYIILVSNLKNNPQITIVKNFSEEFTEEYLAMASKNFLYINRINSKYIIKNE